MDLAAPAIAAFDPLKVAPRPHHYDGTRDALVIRRWLDAFEHYADVVNIPNDTQKINIATLYFTGRARDWWSFFRRRINLGEVAIKHWGPDPTIVPPAAQ